MTAKWTRPADIRDQLQRFWDKGISVPTEADGLALIGERRRLLGELLDAVLPPAAIDASATGANGFAQRYGLRHRPTLIRFRVLDPSLAIAGLTDLSVPVDDFAALFIPPGPVFITENKINGLAFPACRGGLVIFGLGYGVEALSAVPRLQERRIDQWGDIDTHGFAILNRLRRHLPQTLYQAIRDNTLGDCLRLEQERIAFGAV